MIDVECHSQVIRYQRSRLEFLSVFDDLGMRLSCHSTVLLQDRLALESGFTEICNQSACPGRF